MSMVPTDFHQGYIDGAYWTMAYEIKFAVIIYGIIIFRNVTIRNSMLVTWLMFSIIVGILKVDLHHIIVFAMKEVFIMDFIQAFIAGIAIANLKNNYRFNAIILTLCCINQFFWFKEDVIYNSSFASSLSGV
ncbi:MAG: hypothetical protein NC453_18680 [Muribaculum sp.]|nr:hypothetical protein [Muribaculum sp.]